MKDNHGYHAEDRLEKVCFDLFGKELVLRSPILLEESGEKELTDILVLVDDTAIIIQSKSMQIDLSDLDATKLGRIRNRQNKAKIQINTTLNAHQRNSDVKATTAFDLTFNLDWSNIKNKIGIVTLNISDEEYNNPDFRFQYPELTEKHKNIEIHTFLLNDLELITKEISTPADFILYLRARSECVNSERFLIANELDFLGFYKTQYPQLEEMLQSSPQFGRALIAPGFWEEYRAIRKKEINERKRRFKNSLPYDKIVEVLGSGINYSEEKHGYSHQESALNYMKMIGKLGKVTRMERAKIGELIFKKFEKTKNAKFGYFTYINKQFHIAYLFVVLNETDRNLRLRFLEHLCGEIIDSKDKLESFDDFNQVVAIAMNGAQDYESSYDTIIIEDIDTIELLPKEDGVPEMFKQPKKTIINEWDT